MRTSSNETYMLLANDGRGQYLSRLAVKSDAQAQLDVRSRARRNPSGRYYVVAMAENGNLEFVNGAGRFFYGFPYGNHEGPILTTYGQAYANIEEMEAA